MDSRLPIIYVRGFAGSTSGIDRAVDDPFYGFNTGATHVRVGHEGDPIFYQFEGPLLRLITEHQYELRVNGGQQALLQHAGIDEIPPNSLWVYRFYDGAASTFGGRPRPYDIEEAARGLGRFIDLVLEKTGGAEQVYLVAHSMGGLVCRSLIQKHLPQPREKIAKVFTYATPHGGIDVELGGPIGEWVIEKFGPNGSDIFRPETMYRYLTAPTAGPQPAEWDPRSLGGTDFPADRFFCLIGTNPSDYDAAGGWSAKAVGVKSDGLVQIRNAYVKGASRAYVHRSHSGRYGIVNSDEGYQNLRRFLFGRLKVQTGLWHLDLDTTDDLTWQADVRLSIRGVPVVMHEQTAEHHCPVQLVDEARQHDTADSPIPLVTTYLLSGGPGQNHARYALHLRVNALRQSGAVFHFQDHLEQVADWEDTLFVDVRVDPDGQDTDARWEWNSRLAGQIAKVGQMPHKLEWQQKEDGRWLATLPATSHGRAVLGPHAGICLTISRWS